MQPGQCKIVIELDMVAHLDDFIQDGLVKLWLIMEIKRCVVVFLACDELL